MYVCLSIYISACPSIYLSIYLYVCLNLSLCLSIYLYSCLCLSIYLSACLLCSFIHVCLSIYMSVRLYISSVYIYLSVSLCVYLSTSLCMYLFVSLYISINQIYTTNNEFHKVVSYISFIKSFYTNLSENLFIQSFHKIITQIHFLKSLHQFYEYIFIVRYKKAAYIKKKIIHAKMVHIPFHINLSSLYKMNCDFQTIIIRITFFLNLLNYFFAENIFFIYVIRDYNIILFDFKIQESHFIFFII